MITKRAKWMRGAAVALAFAAPQIVSAQTLAERSGSDLRNEVQSRYDAALTVSTDVNVISQNSAVHNWASDTKVQCGIALGFLKSGTRDEDSLRRCDFAYGMMNAPRQPAAPVVAPPPPPPPPPADNCPPEVAATFFFDFDSVIPSSDAQESASFMAANQQRCGWHHFTVVGHTDRAGSNLYNDKLSLRRAQAVTDLMTAAGISSANISASGKGEAELRVQTIDGERTPANRRVEVRVNETGVN